VYHHGAQVVAERAEQAVIYFVQRATAEPADGPAGPHQAGPGTTPPSVGLFLTEPVRGLIDPATLWLVADRLAAPPGQHRPFRPPPLLRPFYPDRR
jgi:hypothetical protein